jgi:hypothetical protein
VSRQAVGTSLSDKNGKFDEHDKEELKKRVTMRPY